MTISSKLISWERLQNWCDQVRGDGFKLVVTNGCFDILHAGHVTYLEAARTQGDKLLVGINSDQSVKNLKGPDRPINCAEDRALVVAALESVSAVCIFEEDNALRFLALTKPDVYVKGGDYDLDSINQAERRLVEQLGGKVVVVGGVPGKSTTNLLKAVGKG